MQSKLFSVVLLLSGLISNIPSVSASPTADVSLLVERQQYCGPTGCIQAGGSSFCDGRGCDGRCLSDANRCGGFAPCSTRPIKCRRTIEFDIAMKAGLLYEREDGEFETRDGADEHVAAVLESWRKK